MFHLFFLSIISLSPSTSFTICLKFHHFLFFYHPSFPLSLSISTSSNPDVQPAPALCLSLSLFLSATPSSGRILLHDQSFSGSRVWGGGGPVFLLGHHLRWSHVHPGSHRDLSGGFHLSFKFDLIFYILYIAISM